MKRSPLLLFTVFLVLFSASVLASSHLPPGLLEIEKYNNDLAREALQKVSLFIAFLAGVTSIVSPCILPLIPAYFAVTFKEKKRITLATALFFAGFASVYALMALLATLTGRTLVTIFKGIDWLVPAAGLLLIAFGFQTISGKGFGGIVKQKKLGRSKWSVVSSGALFAVGWTACVGPIVSAVLLMVSAFQNYARGALIMFFYSLGIFVPLFILSFFYDRLNMHKLAWLSKRISIKVAGHKIKTTLPNIISGVLFIILGGVFVVYRGTWIVNSFQMFGLKKYFYSWQNHFMNNIEAYNIAGFLLFAGFIAALAYFLIREDKNEHNQKN